jgi:signal transduction histidine kinase
LDQQAQYFVGVKRDITKEDEKKIFAKFFRAPNARETTASGNGLGLFFIKKVIETVGGQITSTIKIFLFID